MPQTETISVTVSADLAQKIREQVHSGHFQSENDLIVHAITEEIEWSWLPDAPSGESFDKILEWIPEQLARIDSGEEPTYTLEEVEKHLAARRARMQL